MSLKAMFCLAALVTACVTQSKAAIVTLTYTGTVADGHDLTGLFGTANSDLSNDPYVLTYIFDTNLGTRSEQGDTMHVQGGAVSGTTSPTITSYIQINHHTQSVSGFYSGSLEASSSPLNNTIAASAQDFNADGVTYQNNLLSARIGGDSVPYSLDQSFTQTQNDGNPFDGFLRFETEEASIPVIDTEARLFVLSASETVIASGVPEPSAWIMMLLGFAGIWCLAYCKSHRSRVASLA